MNIFLVTVSQLLRATDLHFVPFKCLENCLQQSDCFADLSSSELCLKLHRDFISPSLIILECLKS